MAVPRPMTPPPRSAARSEWVRSTARAPTAPSGPRESLRPSAVLSLSYPRWGRNPRKPSAADAARKTVAARQAAAGCRSVYPKPLQRRPHGVDRTADDDPICRARRGARQLTARSDRVRERHLARGPREALRQLRRAATTRTGQRAHDPVVDDGAERRGDRRGVLVRQHPDDREGPSRAALAVARAWQRALAQLPGEHLGGGWVVRDIQNPLHFARHHLEAAGEPHRAQRRA